MIQCLYRASYGRELDGTELRYEVWEKQEKLESSEIMTVLLGVNKMEEEEKRLEAGIECSNVNYFKQVGNVLREKFIIFH